MAGAPGLGLAAASRSSAVSSHAVRPAMVSASGARAACRWHLARPEPPEHLLEHGGVLGDPPRVHALQRQPRGQRPVVVAPEAVAAECVPQSLGAGRVFRARAVRPRRPGCPWLGCRRWPGRRVRDRSQAEERRNRCRGEADSSSVHWFRSVAFESMRKMLSQGPMRRTISSGLVFVSGLALVFVVGLVPTPGARQVGVCPGRRADFRGDGAHRGGPAAGRARSDRARRRRSRRERGARRRVDAAGLGRPA